MEDLCGLADVTTSSSLWVFSRCRDVDLTEGRDRMFVDISPGCRLGRDSKAGTRNESRSACQAGTPGNDCLNSLLVSSSCLVRVDVDGKKVFLRSCQQWRTTVQVSPDYSMDITVVNQLDVVLIIP